MLNDAVAKYFWIAYDLAQAIIQYLYLAADLQQESAYETVAGNVQDRSNCQTDQLMKVSNVKERRRGVVVER